MDIQKVIDIAKESDEYIRVRYNNHEELKVFLKMLETETNYKWSSRTEPTRYIPHRSSGHITIYRDGKISYGAMSESNYDYYQRRKCIYQCSEIISTIKIPSKPDLMEFLGV